MLTQYLDAVGKLPMENHSKTKGQKAAFLIGSETRKRKFKRVVEEYTLGAKAAKCTVKS